MTVRLPLGSDFGVRLGAKLRCILPVILGLLCVPSAEAALSATFQAATDVPVTAASYTPTGDVDFTLNFAPEPGTNLTVVKNTGLPFINGTFTNLPNGATVNLTHNGTTYPFVAWYYGGEGNNDLVLLWPYTGLAAWGDNEFGQLGDGTNQDHHQAPVCVNQSGVLAGKTIVRVARGAYHTLALTSEGRVYAWGHNVFGTLGNNTESNNIPLPVEVDVESGVSALFGKTVISLAAGDAHSLALCSDGTVAAWGWNQHGQLGDNTTQNRPTPVAVNADSDTSALFGKSVVAISAGANHSLVLCSDGSMASWGSNTSGQLGDQTLTGRLAPVSTGNGASALRYKTVVAIASGASHGLALCSDGTLMSWGSNFAGALGDNTTSQRSEVAPVNTDSGMSALFGRSVVSMAAGRGHSLALCSDGTLTGWGWNHRYQLGNATVTQHLLPVVIKSGILNGSTVVGVASGNVSSTALLSNGTVAVWGLMEGGGSSSPAPVKRPLAVSPLARLTTMSLAGSGSQADHYMVLFGSAFKEITVLGNGREIASGDMMADAADGTNFGAVLLSTGPRVRSFAIANTGLAELNLTGAPKIAISGPHAADFVVTSVPASPVAPLSDTTTFPIAFAPTGAGLRNATVSILNDDSDESLYTFGIQGLGSTSGLSLDSAADAAVTVGSYVASGDASLTLNFAPQPGTTLTVVKNTGPSFIEGTFANLPNGATVNLSYNGVTYSFVAWYYGGEGNNDLVLLWPGTVLAVWGNNSSGQLAVANSSGQIRHHWPELANTYGLLEGKTIVQVAQGGAHTLALTAEGKVYAWGSNIYGQLGDNTSAAKSAPVEVNAIVGTSSLAGKTVVAIAAGTSHSLALCSDGTVSAWGGGSAELGRGTIGSSSVPVAVSTTSALNGKIVTAIAAGAAHNLVLCSDGTLAGWGSNWGGQLGDGSTVQRLVPVAVNATDGMSALFGKVVASVVAGETHSLALCADGSLVAWGYNDRGQLGDGSATARPLPVPVAMTGVLASKTVTSISTGSAHSLALCSDGTLASWGANEEGQIGNNSVTNQTLPVMVNAALDVSVLFGKRVVSIACGERHSLALCSDNTLAAWGDDEYGQLGNGDGGTSSRVPVGVYHGSLSYLSAPAGQKITGLPHRSGGGGSNSSVVMIQGVLRDIFVTGNNQEIVSGDTMPEAGDFTDFGDVPLVGDSVTRTFWIANKGLGRLNFTGSYAVSTFSVPYSGFGVSRDPVSSYIAGAGRLSFDITCAPRALGTQTATVLIYSDDPDEPVYSFNLQCFGRGSEIEVRDAGVNVAASSTVSLGNAGSGSGLVQKTFVINNLGNADLTGLTLTKGGQNAEDFTIFMAPTAPVPPGGSTSLTVQANPRALGARSASLFITNNDYNESSFRINLTVTGINPVQPLAAKPSVTGIMFDGAMLKAEVKAQNSERHVFFEYGTTNSYGSRVVATPATITGTSLTQVSADVTGLLPNTMYHFRVRAEGALGSANGEDKTFTTLNRPPVAAADSAVVLPMGRVTIPVLVNDTDPGDILNIASFTQPPAAVGSVTKVANTLVFTAAAGFTGGSFTYMAGDAYRGKSAAAMVTLTLGTCTIGPDVTIPADSPPYELAVTATGPFGVLENISWLSFVPPAPGATSVTIIPAPNASKTSRKAVVKVGGQTHNVTQSGVSELPVLTVPAPIPNAAVSANYDLAIPTQNGPVTYTATGLPKGLTLSNVTGKITGYPTEAKTSTVTVKAKNVQGDSNTIRFDITVLRFPLLMAGSYSATIPDSATLTDKLGGLMTMTVTGSGGVTGTLKLGAGSHPFTGRLNTAENPWAPDPDHAVLKTSVKRTGKPNVDLTVRMNSPSTDLIAGEVTLPGAQPAAVELTGSRHVWQAAKPANDYKGYFTVALFPSSTASDIPQGKGFLTFTVSPLGGVSWSGQLADGTVIPAQTATLWANGRLPLFALLYGGKGSLSQSLAIAPVNRSVTGALRWHKKPQVARAHSSGFEPSTLQAFGGEYLPPSPGDTLFNLEPPATVGIDFLDGGIGSVGQFSVLDQVFNVSSTHVATVSDEEFNYGKVKLTKVDVAKGTFTGTFTLKDDNRFTVNPPLVTRVVTFQGALVPSLGMGTGYFLLPGIAGPPLNVTTSPMTSGQVRLRPWP